MKLSANVDDEYFCFFSVQHDFVIVIGLMNQ